MCVCSSVCVCLCVCVCVSLFPPSPAPLKQQTVTYSAVMCKQRVDKSPVRPASGAQQGEASAATAAPSLGFISACRGLGGEEDEQRGRQQRANGRFSSCSRVISGTFGLNQNSRWETFQMGSAGLMLQPLLMWLDVPDMDGRRSRRWTSQTWIDVPVVDQGREVLCKSLTKVRVSI